METQQVSTWTQIRDVIESIQRQYSKTSIEGVEQSHLILFRGATNNDWLLETTLERHSRHSWTVGSYYESIFYCAPQIESFFGYSWNLGTNEQIEKDLSKSFSDLYVQLPHYEYWAYLRHHGFPSPLLDWTKSPYVALFFAVCDVSTATQSSLYAYIEKPRGTKGGVVGAPMITVQHPYTKTHKRHFLQQSYYTVATEIEGDSFKDHLFISHEKVFQKTQTYQDILIKIIFPRTLREEILRELNNFNINHYSLFQSEDALIKTLGMKEIEFIR